MAALLLVLLVDLFALQYRGAAALAAPAAAAAATESPTPSPSLNSEALVKLDSDYENFRRRIDTSSTPAPTTGLAYHYEVYTWDNAYTSCDIGNRMPGFDGTDFVYYPPDSVNSDCFASCDDDPYCNFAAITDMQELRDVTSVSDNEGVFCSDYGSARCLLNLQYDDSDFSSNDYCAVCGGGVQYMVSDRRLVGAHMNAVISRRKEVGGFNPGKPSKWGQTSSRTPSLKERSARPRHTTQRHSDTTKQRNSDKTKQRHTDTTTQRHDDGWPIVTGKDGRRLRTATSISPSPRPPPPPSPPRRLSHVCRLVTGLSPRP